MRHLIKKNRHYATPFPWPRFYKKGQVYTYSLCVKFNEDCRYDIDVDQSDVNKLYGLSYGFHHTNSDRFGWRYNKEMDKMEIVAYSYQDGVRIKTHSLGFIDFDQDAELVLQVSFEGNTRKIIFTTDFGNKSYQTTFEMEKVPCWGYTLGLYFGGNRRAPHEMSCFINNEKLDIKP